MTRILAVDTLHFECKMVMWYGALLHSCDVISVSVLRCNSFCVSAWHRDPCSWSRGLHLNDADSAKRTDWTLCIASAHGHDTSSLKHTCTSRHLHQTWGGSECAAILSLRS